MTILDTDCFSDILKGNVEYSRRFQAMPRTARGVAIITVEEILRGRLAIIRKFQSGGSQARLQLSYGHFSRSVVAFFDLTMLPYNPAAHDIYLRLKSQKIRVGTQDLRIASIALAHDATLITRNCRDYELVPSLKLEVWN